MYLGSVIGAGFASGREAWQYFGVFGNQGYYGIAMEAVLFMACGMATSYLALKRQSAEIDRVILPVYNKKMGTALGTLVAMLLFIPLVSMSAAGGALLEQELGLHPAIGGAVIVILVVLTLFGDFERMQKVFRMVMPLLFVIIIGLSLYVALTFERVTPEPGAIQPSPLADSWAPAAFVYVSYNTLGTFPILSRCAIESKSPRHSLGGAALGGILLALLGLVLLTALLKDPVYTDSLSMPMLGYAARTSKALELVFSLVLLIAIYSAATSCYFGCISRFKDDQYKKAKIVFFAFIAFAIGLIGFKKIIAIIYPVFGYVNCIVLALLTISFFKVLLEERKKKPL